MPSAQSIYRKVFKAFSFHFQKFYYQIKYFLEFILSIVRPNSIDRQGETFIGPLFLGIAGAVLTGKDQSKVI